MNANPSSSTILEGGRFGMPDPAKGAGEPEGFISEGGTAADDTSDGEWIELAQRCFTTSSQFFDGDVRRKIEDSMRLFRGEHASGSKYLTPAFEKRSKIFRPKTRAMVRKLEAAAAIAFFSTSDIINVKAPNQRDKAQVLAARVQDSLLNHRLTETMPWFATMMGAVQDAARQGFVIGCTEWRFREGARYFRGRDAMTGAEFREIENFIAEDRPDLRLVPIENIRFDPGCDWRDPMGTSPYIIEMMPYYLTDIRTMMQNPRAIYPFRQLSDEQLLAGRKNSWDSIRAAREGNRGDRYDQMASLDDYTTVWIHRNIVKIEGEDYVFLTVGTEYLLTDPIPLSELDPRGYRPYIFGSLMVEAHNPMPDGPVMIGKGLQEEINEIANTRIDNVKLSMMGRYFTRRGSNVDLDALVRFVPGSAVEMGDVNRDVRWDKAPDATRGAFEEQNYLQLEMDDLFGNFSGASVANNRKLNETVGGMTMLGEGANVLTELMLRTFNETFVEPAMRHFLDLITLWETDEDVAKIVGDGIGMEPAQVFAALGQKMRAKVDVGFGSTSPMQRVERMGIGLGALAQYFPGLIQQADQAEIATEIFGALGFSDGSRFFPTLRKEGEDPQLTQLRDQLAQMQSMLESKQMEFQSRERIAQMNAQARVQVAQLQTASAETRDRMKLDLMFMVEQAKSEISRIDLQLEAETNQMRRVELAMQREALSHTIQMAERQFQLQLQTTPLAPPPGPVDRPIPQGAAQLVEGLRKPGSSMAGAPAKLPAVGGEDKAGVLARGDYGSMPFAEG